MFGACLWIILNFCLWHSVHNVQIQATSIHCFCYHCEIYIPTLIMIIITIMVVMISCCCSIWTKGCRSRVCFGRCYWQRLGLSSTSSTGTLPCICFIVHVAQYTHFNVFSVHEWVWLTLLCIVLRMHLCIWPLLFLFYILVHTHIWMNALRTGPYNLEGLDCFAKWRNFCSYYVQCETIYWLRSAWDLMNGFVEELEMMVDNNKVIYKLCCFGSSSRTNICKAAWYKTQPQFFFK